LAAPEDGLAFEKSIDGSKSLKKENQKCLQLIQ